MARTLYGDRWQVIGSFSGGGQGDVFIVRDNTRAFEGEWLLKRLRNPNRIGRFEQEIKALETLNSPHVPKVIDHSASEPAFIVYGKVGDKTLHEACSQQRPAIDTALSIFQQIVQAARDAHEANIAHRDIKPNNVCVSEDLHRAFLIDFGICQLVESELILTAIDEPLGNILFAAPECIPGSSGSPGPHSDVYSLGKLLYWMTSSPGHIHREELSEPVIGRMNCPSELIRFHVARLLRGTVIADSTRRWTSKVLLDHINEVRQILAVLRERRLAGDITVADGLGLNDSFNRGSSRSVTTSPRGNPPGDYELAELFEIPSDSDVFLKSIAVALEVRAGAGKKAFRIQILPDRDGAPDDSASLEELRVDVFSGPSSVLSTDSVRMPPLSAGGKYWTAFSVGGPGSEIAIWGSPENFMPRRSIFAERLKGRAWEVKESPSGPGHAIRILGRGK